MNRACFRKIMNIVNGRSSVVTRPPVVLGELIYREWLIIQRTGRGKNCFSFYRTFRKSRLATVKRLRLFYDSHHRGNCHAFTIKARVVAKPTVPRSIANVIFNKYTDLWEELFRFSRCEAIITGKRKSELAFVFSRSIFKETPRNRRTDRCCRIRDGTVPVNLHL